MSKFAEVVCCPRLRRLDFGLVPKSLRSRMMELLGTFMHVKVLTLGSNGGQWLFKNVTEHLVEVNKLK